MEIPDRLAGEVLRYVVLGLREHVRHNAGTVTPDCQRLLHALAAAADQGSTASGTSEPESATLDTGHGLTCLQVADRLGCTVGYVRRLARAGRLTGKRVGRDWLIQLEEDKR